MKITFKLEQEDYIDFNLNHVKVNPGMKKQILKVKMMSIVLVGIMTVLAAIFTDVSPTYWAFSALLLSLGFYFYVPKIVEKNVRKGVPKMLEKEKDKGLFSETSIELIQDGILKINDSGETLRKWESINNIYETSKHIFIYDSSVSAFIIPKSAFNSEAEERQFLERVKNRRYN